MRTRATLSALCLVAMASTSMAQDTHTPSMPTVQGTVSNPRETTMTENAVTLNQKDRTFIMNAAAGGMFEVQSSQLATTASQDQAIQAFAQKMIQDHTTANQQLMQLAASKRVAVPTTLDAKHARMLANLQGKQAQQFDQTYVRMQLRAHKEAVATFQEAATNAEDPEVKQFAATTLPVLQQHLQQAQQLPGAEKAREGKAGKKGKKNNTNNNMQPQNPAAESDAAPKTDGASNSN